MKTILSLIITFVASLALAALKSDGKTHFEQKREEKLFSITVDDGFHFNLEAPTFLLNGTSKSKPSYATETKLQFSQPQSLESGAKIQYYVCDNAKTVCEPHTETLNNAREIKVTSKEVNAIKLKTKKDSEGFYVDNFEAAIKEGSETHKIILVDFTASWCPACLRLSHESFKTKPFKKIKANYVLLKMDVDKSENQTLIEKYSIKAFPTIVLINHKGEELDRILDYLPGELLVSKIKSISSNNTVSEIKKKAEAGDKNAILAMAVNAFKAQQPKECVDWFEKSGQKPIEYYQCLISTVEDSPNEKQVPILESAISSFSNSFYSFDWRLKLIELYDSEQKKLALINQTEELCRSWIKDPKSKLALQPEDQLAELGDLVVPELHFYLGTLLELQKSTADAKVEFHRSVSETLLLKPTVTNPTIVIYLVHYLKKTEDFETATAWLHKLQKTYPSEFTYYHREATLLSDLKNFAEALPVGLKAYELSYGNNRIKTGLLLAKIQKSLEKKTEAKSTLESLREQFSTPNQKNTVYLNKIETALKDLN